MYVKVICAMCVGGCDCGFVVAVGYVVCGFVRVCRACGFYVGCVVCL